MPDPPAQAVQAAEAGTPQIFVPPSNLPPPKALSFDDNLATTWKSWKQAWKRYEIATGVHKQEGLVRVSTLLSIIGEDGVKAHDTFVWNETEDPNNIELVLQKFDQFCAPRTQVIYERYRFNNRNQEPGENITSYVTELRTIARNCAHDTITPDEILRDRLVLGIRDDRVRERLLRLNDLTLQQAVDQIKSSKDLNRAIRREHYQLPTIDEVASRLAGAKKFTLCDAKDGFHQILLDDTSSYLTSFNSPFGRYRWARMPFGISSAPEVWQRRMHEFVEDLEGVEVIADDFLIAGFGATDAEVNASLEKNERAFLQKCREWNLKLNKTKLKRAQTEVRFMGHLLTPEGLKADPSKVEAILDMPPPNDIKGLKRFLGMVNYLAKFLPLLSDMTEPLRRLDDKEVEWCWLEQHQKAFTTIKQYLADAPVLKYYDVNEEVTIQCDASETGLGAVLVQKGQPIAFASRALTDTETRYAQIEKELLAIVWSANKFDQYTLGRDCVHIESDHEPLKAVFNKPVHKSPKRLQRMLMALQNYSLDVQYKKGELMWISDALSRAYRNTTEFVQHDTSLVCSIEEVDHLENLSIAPYRIAEFRRETSNDAVLQSLIASIKSGWASSKKQCDPVLTPYYDKRSELVEDKGLIFLGERLVVPTSLRKEMLKQIHRSHIGIEGCLRRAREVLYWPLMNAEVKDFISKCSICQSHKPDQCREDMQPYPVPPRPWSMLAADLFELGQQQFFLLVDYWSGFFEVQELKVATSASVIAACKVQFSRHGIPEVLITDNGSQFASSAFIAFAREWQFEHRTSSPRYPQSNGRAENAVKTCKNLMKKAKADGQDPLLALLDWRNTPTERIGTSPAQRLMGRRTRTLLPTHENLLMQSAHSDTATKLADRKSRQVRQYNKRSRPLEPLKCGQAIRMRLPGKQEWSLGTCTRVLKNRSYEVEICGRRYRRNRRQLRMTPEVPPPVNLQESELPDPIPKQSQNLRQETNQNPEQESAEPLVASPNLNSGAHTEPEVDPVEELPRRSERRRCPPRREREMQQKLEEKDENTVEIKETFSSLQQEVDSKTKKLKKLFGKLQTIRSEIADQQEAHIQERQELEQAQEDLTRELKLKTLIIENFIPPDERNKLTNRASYDEENEEWKLKPSSQNSSQQAMAKRPVSAVGNRRPITEYAKMAAAMGGHMRYKAENIIMIELDMPNRTTRDYEGPAVAPKVQAALDAALQDEEDLTLDADVLLSKTKVKSKRRDKPDRTERPKTGRKSRGPQSSGQQQGSSESAQYPTARGLLAQQKRVLPQ
ncbi:hypothetical protein ACROYT_G015844 [Oculina patagonica]